MANFKANTRYILTSVDLNAYERFFLADEFVDDGNLTVNGIVYPDAYVVRAFDIPANTDLGFFGSGFVRDQNGTFTAGTVNVVLELTVGSSTFDWAVDGVSVSAAAIQAAALTETNADEIAIIAAALAGSDTIEMSPFNDGMKAFGGDDFLDGGAGNDILDGGQGNDTIIGGVGVDTASFSGARSDYVITSEGGGFRVIDQRQVGGDGNDLVSGIEAFEFADIVIGAPNLVPSANPPASQAVLSAGQSFGIVGYQNAPTNVFITATATGAELVTVGDFTTVGLSNNFTSGGDTIRLAGLASNFDISVSGNQVTLASAVDQISVKIPTGFNPIFVSFERSPGVFGDLRALSFLSDGLDADANPDLFFGTQRVFADAPPLDVLAFA